MKKILKDALPSLDYNSEALAIAKAVKILRREILSWKLLPFSGQFPPDCQRTSLPTSLKDQVREYKTILRNKPLSQ